MKELPKIYEPKKYEDEMYRQWLDSGLFNPDACLDKGLTTTRAPAFSIVLPPPNVTGTLHMGHAVMLALEDVMIRYHRMKGDRTVWVPGTDHAAIATQSKVESLLYEETKQTRHDLGREKFLARVEAFAQASHDTIVNQCRKMGASLDWTREAFTLDEARNYAVRTAFKRMFADGLIYRGARLVNWDPLMQCNVADDEIVWVEETAHFYYFQYGPFVIGTARPETKFGDKYVVMHPDDRRYAEYSDGQKLALEWINGSITATVIKDAAVDPEFGSGVMTITPWHDAVDFDIAERLGLEKEQIIDLQGRLLPIAGEFAGLSIAAARQKVVAKLQAKGLVVRSDEAYVHKVATNYRGGGLIEPQIREQWFVNVNAKFKLQNSKLTGIKSGQLVSLKELMQTAVRSGQIEIIPDRFNKQYFHWIDNLRDWCISRQLWYGHRIPVFYCTKEKDAAPYVSVEDITECLCCGAPVQQDPDTLDTWFSAGLWTFSTLGWPGVAGVAGEPGNDLVNYHPTAVLETGYDILFFWVARMILMTTYLLGDVPFRTVYLHGLVRDEQGRKMSKTLDNIIDPLDMIARYGTDATRLSLLIGTTPGNDMKLSEEKVAGFRNFTNKLWNIARFINSRLETPTPDAAYPVARTFADRAILARLDSVVAEVTRDLETYRFSAAGEKLRDFTWGDLADWYLEIAKIEADKSSILNYILNTALKLWHPFMPFVTEAIWVEMYGGERLLMVEPWPRLARAENNGEVWAEFARLQSLVTGLRVWRSEHRLPPSAVVDVEIVAPAGDLIKENLPWIIRFGRLGRANILAPGEKPSGTLAFVAPGLEVYINTVGTIDAGQERARLDKEIISVSNYIASLENKLADAAFIENAPSAVVEKERKKLQEAKARQETLTKQRGVIV
ncbi:MAG: valine--tRNA ligase [Candidatus Magasanikbacteria bacterium]|nr:valine--tRNA ligase [Candidatus Magasanikbacteria bacterium]